MQTSLFANSQRSTNMSLLSEFLPRRKIETGAEGTKYFDFASGPFSLDNACKKDWPIFNTFWNANFDFEQTKYCSKSTVLFLRTSETVDNVRPDSMLLRRGCYPVVIVVDLLMEPENKIKNFNIYLHGLWFSNSSAIDILIVQRAKYQGRVCN